MESLRPVITHSWKQSFHPLSLNDQQQGYLGLRELIAKGENWTPLEELYFRNKHLMLGFLVVIARGYGNKCQRARGDLQWPSLIIENYLLPPKVVFEPSRLHLRGDWIMAVWHTPPMQLSHRHRRTALSCGLQEAPAVPGFGSCCAGPGGKVIVPAAWITSRGCYAGVPGRAIPLNWCMGERRVFKTELGSSKAEIKPGSPREDIECALNIWKNLKVTTAWGWSSTNSIKGSWNFKK